MFGTMMMDVLVETHRPATVPLSEMAFFNWPGD